MKHALIKLDPQLTRVIDALAHLSHLNHRYNQRSITSEVEQKLELEEQDIRHLKSIFSSAYHSLNNAYKELWSTPKGKENMKNILVHHMLPQLQQAIQYDQAITQTVKRINEQTLAIGRDENAKLGMQQTQLIQLAQKIRIIFVQLNTKIVPQLCSVLDEPRYKKTIDKMVQNILHVVAAIYHQIKHMDQLIQTHLGVKAKDNEFVMGMND
jgi:hypothetical protein